MTGLDSTAPALRAERLSARRDRTEVLHDIDLEVAEGEIVGILGPNGAGKSTLLAALGGQLPLSGGRLVRGGRVATAMQTPGLARRTAQANIRLALAWWGVPRRERAARTREALEQMNATHLADRQATLLSGGEQRRVHLARAVAIRPDVLLLDEPFAGLDPETHAALRDDAASALRTSAGAVVVVVHDRAEAWALADRILVLMEGRVAAHGRPRDVLDGPPSADVARFLGYDGEQRLEDGVLLTRPSHVHLDPDGDIRATVTRMIPTEEGCRVELSTARGLLRSQVTGDRTSVGDSVRVRLSGGVRFPSGKHTAPTAPSMDP